MLDWVIELCQNICLKSVNEGHYIINILSYIINILTYIINILFEIWYNLITNLLIKSERSFQNRNVKLLA